MDHEEGQQSPPETAPPPSREYVGPNYHKEGNKTGRIIALLIVLVLLAGAGGGGYWYLKHRPTQKSAATARAAQAAQPKVSTQIDASTRSYTSPNFYLTFSYPANWTITDPGGGQMTVISPAMKLKNAVGQIVTGQIETLFLNSTQTLSGFKEGNAVAVFDSEKISYKNPTPTQRAATYLSLLQYANTAGSGLDGIYITSDNGYQKGQAIPLVDISKEDPIINITFLQCADANCSGKTTPLTIDSANWSNNSFSGPLKNMLESLSIT
ncbi:MAG: hypothetical protein ABSD10_02795 [Candidatus Saccharimonadales bacterium]|jgi:hypothetical protein